MADPVARIRLLNNRTFRGEFEDADALRALGVHATDDYALVYSLKKIYKYDASSTATDDGSDDPAAIKPTDVGGGSGRWIPNNVIQLDGAGSDPSDTGSSIDTYEWIIVFEPSNGVTPTATIASSGATADLTIPVGADWKPGGILVFLRVTDNAGRQSNRNPFDPRLNQDALFSLILPTSNFGFLIPPAGVRNWHKQYADTINRFDDGLFSVASSVPGASVPTNSDKGQHPTASTSGDNQVVPGVTIANTPGADSYVRVYVNGEAMELGDGVANKDCYFIPAGSSPPQNFPRAIADISATDEFVWNGSIAGFDLDTDDLIEFDYITV